MALTAYAPPLMSVLSFNYLVRVLSESDENWLEVIQNFWVAQRKWVRLSWAIGQEGEDARASGMFYTMVVQEVLLCGLELWVMYLWIGKALGGFNHLVIRQLTGRMPQRNRGRTWTYPPLEKAMAGSGIREVETYVAHCQNTFM